VDDETYREYVEQEPSESQSKIHCRSQNGVFRHALYSLMKKIILALVVIIMVSGAAVVWLGWFPVARVSGSTIYYRDLSAAIKAGELFRKETGAPPAKSDEDKERAMLEELVLRQIIKESSSEFGAKSVEEEMQTYLDKVLSGVNTDGLKEAAAKLYNMSLSDFEERVMMPQFREIVVRNRVEASGKDYGAWLEEKARSASVSIYFLPYRWNGTGLEKK